MMMTVLDLVVLKHSVISVPLTWLINEDLWRYWEWWIVVGWTTCDPKRWVCSVALLICGDRILSLRRVCTRYLDTCVSAVMLMWHFTVLHFEVKCTGSCRDRKSTGNVWTQWHCLMRIVSMRAIPILYNTVVTVLLLLERPNTVTLCRVKVELIFSRSKWSIGYILIRFRLWLRLKLFSKHTFRSVLWKIYASICLCLGVIHVLVIFTRW